MEENELNDKIRSLIELIPLFGEFEFSKQDTRYYAGEMQEGINIVANNENNEYALQYLVNEGFAINRHDIKVEGKTFRQLTDKGRVLKECGSMGEYRLVLVREEDKKRLEKEQKAEENRLSKEASISAIETNRSVKTSIYFQIISGLLTVMVAGVAVLLSWLEYKKPPDVIDISPITKQLLQMQKRIDSLDSPSNTSEHTSPSQNRQKK